MPAAHQLQPDPYEQGLKASAGGHHLEAISCFEQALAGKPDDPRVLFALGNTARALGLADAAEQFYGRTLALEPARIEATVNLANLLRAQGRFAEAEALIKPALARNPDSPELQLTLGSIHRETGKNDEAESHYRQALILSPDWPLALVNLADMRVRANDHDAARMLYDCAIARDPDNAQAVLNRAMLHLSLGNFRDGWHDYAARLKLPGKTVHRDHGLAQWNGASLKEQLLVTAEQGIGDQIMFASLIPELAARAREDGGTIVLECEPRLVPLFARSFGGVAVRPCRMEMRGETFAQYDWLKREGGASRAIDMGSLPGHLRRALSDFPNPHVYLKPDAGDTRRWQEFFCGTGDAPRIGVCWRSGKSGGARSLQYAPLPLWGEFLRALPGTLVCAQYDALPDEIAQLEAMSGRPVIVPPSLDQKNELDRTAAMFCALDAVISAPTAVSWLAAAAGVPTFKIPYHANWTSFGQSYEPFAPACICLQPATAGNWPDAFAKTAAAIRARF